MSRIVNWTVSALVAALVACSISLFAMHRARAHSWYDGDCCGTMDCHPVPATEVEEIEPGVWKHIPTGFTFKGPNVRPSRDADYHVCINYGRGLCIYIVQGS